MQMNLVKDDYVKITILWERNDTFDSGGCKFIKGKFSGRGHSLKKRIWSYENF